MFYKQGSLKEITYAFLTTAVNAGFFFPGVADLTSENEGYHNKGKVDSIPLFNSGIFTLRSLL